MSMLDLNLISLYRINGQEWPLLPGLLAPNPPRKPARGREQDRLLIYLTLAGNVMFSSAEYAEITAQVAECFYSTSGSLTFALKAAAESLNTYLVERNTKTGARKEYSLGALVLAALRGPSFYVVQSGPTHVYWLTGGEARHFHDPNLAGKGLGMSQTARLYFAQAALNAGDRMLFCAALPPNWDQSLVTEGGAGSLEFVRRRLFAITDTNVSAVLLQAVDGNGAITILNPSKEVPPEAGPPPEVKAPVAQPPSAAQPPARPVPATPVPGRAGPPPVPTNRPGTPAPSARPANRRPGPAVERSPVPAAAASPASAQKSPPPAAERQAPGPEVPAAEPGRLISPEQREKLVQGARGVARFLLQSIQSGRKLSHSMTAYVEKLIPRLIPGEQDSVALNPSISWLALTAIIIPVVVLTMAFVVYYNYGIPQQYDNAYQSAYAEAQKTLNEHDPTALRTHWKAALDFLTEADQYDSNVPAAQTLRSQAQSALDTLDHVVRVDYHLAFNTPLEPSLRVTHMAASDIDLFLLNDTNGNIIRGTMNGLSYDLDASFDQCQPGTYNGILVGSLIDMIALPRSNPSGASVIGIDASGDLLYCAPDSTPKAVTLKTPNVGWNHITAISYNSGNLYVLDSGARAVWVYVGSPDIQFADPPYFFFGSQIPGHLEQASDMAMNGDDLYLLYQDNHLTTCTLSRIEASPTRCTDPAIFVDTRPGYQSGSTLPDVVFSQITFAGAPDPAVALLEPFTQSVFRFSARALELQNQIQPLPGKDNPLPKDAVITAMAFSPNKVLFIFIGGQVYFAVNIP